MRKTFKYKVKINEKTEANCLDWLDKCRTLYNLCLEQRIIYWNQWKKNISYYEQKRELPFFKKEFPEYKNISAQTLQSVIERLDKTYQNFFRKIKKSEKTGFPRFKGKDRYDSFILQQTGWKLEGRYLYIKNVGRFKLFLSRPIEGKIKTVTIKKTNTNQWFVSFSCDEVVPNHFWKPKKEDVGIDVGLKVFLADSEGNKVKNPRFFKKSERELRVKQRSLSRKKKGSIRRRKNRLSVAKTHEKISNQRIDFVNKLVFDYVSRYKNIFIEDLNIKKMVSEKQFSKSISDVSWGLFFNKLQVKAAEAGRVVIKVNPKNTSQRCSSCDCIVPKDLSVRIHKCDCGLVLDRDVNAAINILKLGRADLSGVKSAGTSISPKISRFTRG